MALIASWKGGALICLWVHSEGTGGVVVVQNYHPRRAKTVLLMLPQQLLCVLRSSASPSDP